MNRKFLVSVVGGVVAAAVVAFASTELLSPVSAAEEVPQALASVAEAVDSDNAIAIADVRAIAEEEVLEVVVERVDAVAATQERLRDMSQQVQVTDKHQQTQEDWERVSAEKEWHCPLTVETYISSRYGMRLHPVYGYYRMHKGVDLNSDYGDAVVASRGGTVIRAKYSSSAGYYVEIDHGDGFVTQYMHLSKYIVTVGQEVKAGELIGYVGNTGVSSAPHLHFGMLYNGSFVNPAKYVEF